MEEAFATSSNGFNSIIGNNSLSNHFYHQNGAYDQNDFLMNFYISPMTITNANYPLSATNHHPSSYNPFLCHLHNEEADVNSNNDNWANFNADNFADFDSHFADLKQVNEPAADVKKADDEVEHPTETCFVTTTQTVEITTAPPEGIKRDFVLGAVVVSSTEVKFAADEFDEDEFFSLRDDSNDMSSLTDDVEKKLMENTEVPDDEDDDFASADER